MANQKKSLRKPFIAINLYFFIIDKNFKNFNHTKDENCNENTQ
jgi:hypothetical protein